MTNSMSLAVKTLREIGACSDGIEWLLRVGEVRQNHQENASTSTNHQAQVNLIGAADE